MTKEELFYSETVRRAQEQYEARQHFDTMATAVLGVGGIVLSAMVATVSHWVCWSIVPASIIITSFIVLAIFTIASLRIRTWQFQPSLSNLETNIRSDEYGNNTMLMWSAKWMADAISNNKEWLTYKANCLRRSYVCLAIEILAIGVLVLSTSI